MLQIFALIGQVLQLFAFMLQIFALIGQVLQIFAFMLQIFALIGQVLQIFAFMLQIFALIGQVLQIPSNMRRPKILSFLRFYSANMHATFILIYSIKMRYKTKSRFNRVKRKSIVRILRYFFC